MKITINPPRRDYTTFGEVPLGNVFRQLYSPVVQMKLTPRTAVPLGVGPGSSQVKASSRIHRARVERVVKANQMVLHYPNTELILR